MNPTVFPNGTVSARCPYCNTLASFQLVGSVLVDLQHEFAGKKYNRFLYALVMCGGCRRGVLANIHDNGSFNDAQIESISPSAMDAATLPEGLPDGIQKEFREAELCAAHGAWRAASAMLRSALEKTLKANGYLKGDLKDKINEAAADGVLTESRRKRAQEDIRVLGNDVLHDEWRVVTPEEYEQAHRYAQRILEDFYDDRGSVEAILAAKKRITTAQLGSPAAPAAR